MSKITVFTSLTNPKEPKFFELSSLLDGIREPKVATVSIIEQLRATTDKAERNKLKRSLACVCFSGEFTERTDKAIRQHSGYAVVDLDNLLDVDEVKDKVKLIPYVRAAFISPSGNGLKVVCKIPASIEHHRHNYTKLLEDLSSKIKIDDSNFDETGVNESRACFVSHDPELYDNPNATTFMPPRKEVKITTDYNRIGIAVNMIRLAPDGQKHHILLKASRLMGGYIAGGYVEESMAIQVLEAEISHRDIEDFRNAQKTIKDGIEHGKLDPLYETEGIEAEAKLQQDKVRLRSAKRKYEFLTDPELDDEGLNRYRFGGFQMGASTGYKELDEYFLFKEGEFNVVLGHANTGKSYFMWWLMVLASVGQSWRWIVYSTENKTRQIKKKLIEFYTNKPIQDLFDEDFLEAKAWVDEMFSFIRIDQSYTATDLLDFARVLISEKEYKGFLIDPYNSLGIDKTLWNEMKGNRHEYDYRVASDFVQFCDKENISIFLNAHAHSEALRKKHPQGHQFSGHPMPPESSDIEGGGKFTNRVTGFFIVVHRYIYHPDEWKYTRVEIKKVKDVETGGKPTKYEEAIEFKMNRDMTEFTIRHDGYNPIHPTAGLPSGEDEHEEQPQDYDSDTEVSAPF